MKIKRAEIYKLALPLKEPFRTGFGELTNRRIIFVKLFDTNGLVGIGESANMDFPLYEPDFNDATLLLLKKYLIPHILNKEINTVEELENIYASIKGNNFAKVAIEAAFWHLQSQQQNTPLRKLWGGEKMAY